MGMPISIHIRGEGARSRALEEPVRAAFDDLRAAEDRFSAYRPDSEISRIQRGEQALEQSSADVREVAQLCREALHRTNGVFDAWHCTPERPGAFDPTGLVKTWAVARAAGRFASLPERRLAWAIVAGGDVLARDIPAPGNTEADGWRIGIEDPADRSRVLAAVPLRDGGVCTSGTAARGSHIVDPRDGQSAREIVVQATVAAPSVVWADIWATALVAMGEEARTRTASLAGTSGLLVFADRQTHRWANGG